MGFYVGGSAGTGPIHILHVTVSGEGGGVATISNLNLEHKDSKQRLNAE